MLRLPTSTLWVIVLAAACHSDLRSGRCDPFRTPRTDGPPLSQGEEKSAHAPYSGGDCTACHLTDPTLAAVTEEDARLQARVIRPVNAHCVSCHRELFHAPPRGHPPEQASCTVCHDPHRSRLRSLLRDEDLSRACLDYPPPYPEKRDAIAGPPPPPRTWSR